VQESGVQQPVQEQPADVLSPPPQLALFHAESGNSLALTLNSNAVTVGRTHTVSWIQDNGVSRKAVSVVVNEDNISLQVTCIRQNAVSTASKLEPGTFNRLETGESVTLFIGDALCLRPDERWPLIYSATYL
jgi:hypothetical protein